VGSARALVPGTLPQIRTYKARTDMGSELPLIAFKVLSHFNHVRQLNINSRLLGPYGTVSASEPGQTVHYLRGLRAILSKTMSECHSLS
jgi:hypothetical protein